jgi:long-chain acyl-CoA synthetase
MSDREQLDTKTPINHHSSSTAKSLVDYSSINSLSDIWSIAAQKFGDIIALHDPHGKPEVKLTFSQLNRKIQQFAAALQSLGVRSQSKVALFADNSSRWFIADQGVMATGAADAVRSASAERQELLYILEDSDSTTLIVEDIETLNKLQPELETLPVNLVILLSSEAPPEINNSQVFNFEQLMEIGEKNQFQTPDKDRQNLATLIYTSGTTGQPKGAMLSHSNLLHQVNNLQPLLGTKPGDRFLSILPSWHVYERSCEYFALSRGCTLIYTNLRSFKRDLQRFNPHYMVGVPRLWESLYEGIQKQISEQPRSRQKLIAFFLKNSERYIMAKRIANNMSLLHLDASAKERAIAKIKAATLAPLHAVADRLAYKKIRDAVGGNIKTLVSGGGSLAIFLDNFYEIVNISVIVGYGLTETSPVTNARDPKDNLRGSSGKPIAHTEIRIVDPETRQTLPQGKRGLVLIRGPQVMQGYYKKPEATAKAIDSEGWFDSGDLGWVTANNDLVLTGRAKDTIVLSNGENIEPQPIEDACLRSPYINQIMLVGQDKRSLGALIVPNLETLQQWSQEKQLNLNLPSADTSEVEAKNSDLFGKAVRDLYRSELNREVQNRPGYRPDDRIGVFELIVEPFSQTNGMMTQTLKIKRNVVTEHYHQLIEKMFG